jgi:hypothetical protein
MKLTKSKLKQIIKEELSNVLMEMLPGDPRDEGPRDPAADERWRQHQEEEADLDVVGLHPKVARKQAEALKKKCYQPMGARGLKWQCGTGAKQRLAALEKRAKVKE